MLFENLFAVVLMQRPSDVLISVSLGAYLNASEEKDARYLLASFDVRASPLRPVEQTSTASPILRRLFSSTYFLYTHTVPYARNPDDELLTHEPPPVGARSRSQPTGAAAYCEGSSGCSCRPYIVEWRTDFQSVLNLLLRRPSGEKRFTRLLLGCVT